MNGPRTAAGGLELDVPTIRQETSCRSDHFGGTERRRGEHNGRDRATCPRAWGHRAGRGWCHRAGLEFDLDEDGPDGVGVDRVVLDAAGRKYGSPTTIAADATPAEPLMAKVRVVSGTTT